MCKKILIVLLFILSTISSCEKNTASSRRENVSEENIPVVEEVEIFINEYRWIDSKDGMRMREAPDPSSETITTIPGYEKVLLLKETGDEMTLQEHTGKWSNIRWNDQTGWVFGGYLSREELVDLSQSTYISGKYYLVDDPYNEQYIEFFDDNTSIIYENMCEGFYKAEYIYTLNNKIIEIYDAHEPVADSAFIEISIITVEELELTKGASAITCGNLQDPTKLLLTMK